MDNTSSASGGSHRFRRIPRHSSALLNSDSSLENLEQWPHLSELVQCYSTNWVKYEHKYGHYECIPHVSLQNQIFEDTDIETEIHLTSARQRKSKSAMEEDIPSTSGRQLNEESDFSKHVGQSPLPAYEPAID